LEKKHRAMLDAPQASFGGGAMTPEKRRRTTTALVAGPADAKRQVRASERDAMEGSESQQQRAMRVVSSRHPKKTLTHAHAHMQKPPNQTINKKNRHTRSSAAASAFA
jgi:hypothetical protein